MHLTGWHVDAFGALTDVGVRDVPPGLVVLEGPNASGKSTLLAFIRRTLFGHPHGNRRDVNHYHPLTGERRGGRLYLDADGEVTVERHAGPGGGLRVLTGDGRVGDESTVAELTGGCDEQLFNAVFAFDLDDLADDGLADDAVRDRLFSAGVRGAGPSARAVRERLSADARALWTPLSRRAAIDEVQEQIAALGVELDEARRIAAAYPERLAQEREAQRRVGELDARLEGVARREQLTVRCEEARNRLEELEAERAAVTRQRAELEPDTGLLEHADELLLLDQERLVQRDRLRRVEQLTTERDRLREALRASLSALGPEWDDARLTAVDVSVEVRAELRGWQHHLDALERQVHDAGRDLDGAEAALAAARRREERVRDVVAEVGSSMPSRDELESRRDDLAQLRAGLAEAEASENALTTATRHTDSLGPAIPGWSVPLIGLLVGLVTVGGVWAALTGAIAVTAVLALVALALLALGAVASRSRGEPSADAPVVAARRASQRTVHELAEHVQALGLPERPSFADVERVGVELERAERQRAELERRFEALEEATASRADAEGAYADLRARAVALGGELEDAEAAWADWCEKRELDVGASPAVVAELVAAVDHARQVRQRLVDTTAQLAEVEREAAGYARRAEDVLSRATQSRHASGAERPAQLSLIVELAEAVREARAARVDAQGLDKRLAQLSAEQEQVRVRIQALERQAAELRRDDAAGVERHELSAARDEAFRQLVEARRRLEQVETSQQVAELDQRRQILLAQRDGLVHQWRVDTLACQLVARTLESFERDRQPGVLRAAGAHFAQVTEHAYTGTVQEGEQMVVLDADGRSWGVDTLSRGTVEQLYLCLRLALAEDLATRRRQLPFVMDDVLVNFDPHRAARVAELLADVAGHGQLLYFTCRPETTQLLRDAGAAAVYDLPGAGGAPRRRPA